MYRKLLCMVMAAFAFLTFLASVVYADNAAAREEIIAQKLDTYSRCVEEHRDVNWVDVCFTTQARMNKVLEGESSVAQKDEDADAEENIDEPAEIPESDMKDSDEGYNKDATQNKGSQPSEFIDIGYVEIAAAASDSTGGISYTDIATTSEKDYDRYQLHEDYYQDVNPNSLVWAVSRNNDLTKFEVGTESYYYDYREPGLMKDQGMTYGIYGSYTYRTSENKHVKSLKDVFSDTNKINMFKMDVRFAFGDIDYESNGSGTMKGTEYFTFEGRGLFGYDVPIKSRSRVTPYLGLGWRYLKDDSGGKTSSTGHWGYDRESEYFYMPIGIEANTRTTNDWDLTFMVEYDYFISGKQTSHLEDVGLSVQSATDSTWYALDPLKNDQKDGYGLRGSLKAVKKSEKIDFVVEPFVRYWNIDKSEETQLSSLGGSIVWYGDENLTQPIVGYEPDNETVEYGIKLGIQY